MLKAIGKFLLVDAFAEDAAGTADLRKLGILETTHLIKWGEGVSSGTVEIETADKASYAGTWAQVATIVFSGVAPKIDYVRVQGAYGALRHRISQIVTDGTVSSKIEGSL